MRILGIDPGIAIMGYGILDYEGNRFKVVDYGSIITSNKDSMPKRLEILYNSLEEIIKEYKPDAASFEELFFNQNSKTAIIVGQARGVAILCAQKNSIDVYEYTPLQVKQAVVGYGRAEKKQIQQMVKVLLNLKDVPKPDDTADALAVAICHGHSSHVGEIFKIK